MTMRLSRFLVVGGLGFAVQLSVATVLLVMGVPAVASPPIAIEAAIVHHHAWHRRWAWRDRADGTPWLQTLLRSHVGSGATSLVAGVAAVALLAGVVPPIAAQVAAVATCAAANYLIADRWVFARRPALTFFAAGALLMALPPAAHASSPSAEALHSWDRYVRTLERVRASETGRGVPAWASDEDQDGTRTLAALQAGRVVVQRRELRGVDVSGATLEHWQGSVLLRGRSLDDVAHRVRHPERYRQPPDVLELHVTSRSATGHEIYLRLARSMLVTATYDTWHRVRHVERGATRLDSVSVASRIDEVVDAGTPRERRVPADDSRGFLWRMQSSWRFVQTPDGVVVTCESLTLSRPVPFGLGVVARPVITRVARESMTTAVRAWQSPPSPRIR